MKHANLVSLARKTYNEGKNITAALRDSLGITANTAEIIEIAYDLQAGYYIDRACKHRLAFEKYCDALSRILEKACATLPEFQSVLDIGTGEMTVFSGIVSRIFLNRKKLFACDISLSRLIKGREFVQKSKAQGLIKPIVADFFELPFVDKSIDIIISIHALEPNGGREQIALTEIFRVARKLVVLFEPSYEHNSSEGRKRMNSLGYIHGLPDAIQKAGGNLIASNPMPANETYFDPLNPTWAYICIPPDEEEVKSNPEKVYACPATKLEMIEYGGFFHCRESGLIYPIIDGIPILRTKNGILATVL